MRTAFLFIVVLCISMAAGEGICAEAVSNVGVIKFERLTEKVIRVQTRENEFTEHLATIVNEEVSGEPGIVHGNFFKLAEGVDGNAIRLDGYTAYITINSKHAPKVSEGFSIQAWIALGAYPMNRCPVINQGNEKDAGYSLDIDARGHVSLNIGAGGKWNQLIYRKSLPLNTWTHVAGVYSPEGGMKLYFNGDEVCSIKVKGEFTPADALDVLIGRTRVKRRPEGTIRANATAEVHEYLDGLVDELRVKQGAADSNEVSRAYEDFKAPAEPALPERVLPSGPNDLKEFGAYDMTLSYYDAWDAAWRVTDYSDVVIAFDESPCRFVFWRGTNYIPHWVTENGIWYNNEFNETWSERGCHEPMSDKDCRYSRVRVIENNDARVVVKWRYALVDNWYQFAKVNEHTGWGDWTDEVYTIYPDMSGVRRVSLMSEAPSLPHEWHESIVVMSPGQRPEDVLELDALTLINQKGQTKTYSWKDAIPPAEPQEPEKANIQIINTHSKYKPFACFRLQDEPWPDVYASEIRRDVCVFPWWNHWPVATCPSDGRYAMTSDRASSSSLTHWHWNTYKEEPKCWTKIMLHGVTDKDAAWLTSLNASWSSPPELKIKSGNFEAKGYEAAEKAYQLRCTQPGKPSELTVGIDASEQSPLVNPAFVIEDWGQTSIVMKAGNGAVVKPGRTFRVGHRKSAGVSDAIVWLAAEETTPVTLTFTPVE